MDARTSIVTATPLHPGLFWCDPCWPSWGKWWGHWALVSSCRLPLSSTFSSPALLLAHASFPTPQELYSSSNNNINNTAPGTIYRVLNYSSQRVVWYIKLWKHFWHSAVTTQVEGGEIRRARSPFPPSNPGVCIPLFNIGFEVAYYGVGILVSTSHFPLSQAI